MSELLSDPRVLWALTVVVVVPAIIIGTGELEERLRQRDSGLAPIVTTLRTWTVPLVAVWIVLSGLLGLPSNNPAVRLTASATLLSLLVVVLSLIRKMVVWWRTRPRVEEGRRVPQLLLALPRVAAIIVTGWVLLDWVWGVDLGAALTALGVTSLVISFALQDTLSGLASGLLLLSDAPFQPGDWIRAGDVEGRVVDINWRSSRIETRDGDLLVVPNAELAGSTVVNYDEPTRFHRVVVPVQVAFENPPTRAKEMLLDAARSTPGVLTDPAPSVRVVQIDDPLMGYEVDLWIDDYALAPGVASDFGTLVWYQSERHGVPLPSPAYDVFTYDGLQAREAGTPGPDEIEALLRTSTLIQALDDRDIGDLAGSAEVMRFGSGEVILEADTESRDLLVLGEGWARLVYTEEPSRPVTAAQIGPGEVIGLLGRSRGSTPPHRIVALTDCRVVAIADEAAGSMASRNPSVGVALDHILEARRRRLQGVAEHTSDHPEPEPADTDRSWSADDA